MTKSVYIVEWSEIRALEGVVDSIDGAKRLVHAITGREPKLSYTPQNLPTLVVEYRPGEVQVFRLYPCMYYQEGEADAIVG